jgi:hypothetical protein
MKIIIEYRYSTEECCSDIIFAIEAESVAKVEYDIEMALIDYIDGNRKIEIHDLDLQNFVNAYDDKYFKQNLWANKKNYIRKDDLYYSYDMPKVLELNDWFEYKRKNK